MARNTIQQSIICDVVKGMTTHPSPDEVYQEIQKQYPSIGRATVYRVLNKLADKGEIRKVSIPGVADRFDFRTDDHIHLRCRECNKVFDADFDGAQELLRRLNQVMDSSQSLGPEGFETAGANLSFYGICEDCRKLST